MSERPRSRSIVLSSAVALIPLIALIAPLSASAAQVKGVVDAPPAQPASGRALGYTRTRVASAAASLAQKKADVAVVLMVKTSLPIPAAVEPYKVSISGLRLSPAVAACVVDGKVAFTNDERMPMTIVVERDVFATLQPGETKTYDCSAPEPKLRTLRVKEWPHMRGTLHVGEIGVVAQPGANGAFVLSAPQGKYELLLLGESGALSRREVEVLNRDLDVGRVAADGAAPAGDPPAGATKVDGVQTGALPGRGGATAQPDRRTEPATERAEPAEPTAPKRAAAADVVGPDGSEPN